MNADEVGSGRLLTLWVELSILAMTIAAAAGSARLFSDRDWLRPLVVAAVVAHIVVAGMRRLGSGLIITGLSALVALAAQVSWTHYSASTRFGFPTRATRDLLDADLTSAWNLFSEVKAPTPSQAGFVVMATLAIWLVAYLADWAAFRLSSALEAIIPSFAVVVFISFFGDPADRTVLTAVYLASVAAFLLSHRLWRDTRKMRWLNNSGASGTRSMVSSGLSLAAIAVLGAVVVGPVLPGADEAALVDLDTPGQSDGSRVVISPIVDIRGRLINQADVEVFTVRASEPSYWRLASLDSFNGSIWGADNSYKSVSGALPDDFPAGPEVRTVEQTFSVTNLGAVWIPAAYEPRAVTNSSDDSISYEPISGTLIVGRDLESSDGLSYSVRSELATFDPTTMIDAPNRFPAEVLERYLDLPEDFSQAASDTAREIAGGAGSDYERALALQNWFRDNFVYDLDVGAGHSNARIDTFLASGRGYCEQFAGSFAAMARSIGIPARVAVGFTWGDQDPEDPMLWHVRGEHAHAWPEVYIPGSGWVAFEPTPGRGAPGADGWTGVAPAQHGSNPDAPAVPTPETNPAPDAPDLPPLPPDLIPPSDLAAAGAGTADAGENGRGSRGWFFVIVLALGAAGALYGVVVTSAKWLISRRRHHDRDNRVRLAAVWDDALDRLHPYGLRPTPTETATEFARRAANESPSTADDIRALSSLIVTATYSRDEPSPEMVSKAAAHRDGLAARMREVTTPGRRLRHHLDPRPLLRWGG